MYLCLVFVSCIKNVYATHVLCNWTSSSSCEIKKNISLPLVLVKIYAFVRKERRHDDMRHDVDLRV